jgi:hypothetical protein
MHLKEYHTDHPLHDFGISHRKCVLFLPGGDFIYKDDFTATIWAVVPI